jgi:hypothetical protein
VLAQNAEVWNLSPRFASLLDIPTGLDDDLRSFIPDFTFRLILLAALPFDAIRGTAAGILTLRAMKAERVARILDDRVWDQALMIQVPREALEWLSDEARLRTEQLPGWNTTVAWNKETAESLSAADFAVIKGKPALAAVLSAFSG